MILTHFYFTLYIFKSDTLIHYYKLFNTSLALFISILIFWDLKTWLDYSTIQMFINVFWHGINLGIEFFLNLDHVLLIAFSNQVNSQSNLPISSTSTDPVQIGCSFSGEIEVNNDIDSRHVNTSRNQIGTYQGFELSFSETFEHFRSFFCFHS